MQNQRPATQGDHDGIVLASGVDMLHFAAHAMPPDFLIHDWREAQALWAGLLALGPPRALVIMPDHVHLVTRNLSRDAWLGFMRGFACWRNNHRDEQGRCVWLPASAPEPVNDAKHLQRTVRYVALNPCRDQLVSDPLTWAFSSHRDAVGLAIPGVLPAVRDPVWHHGYVSGDPSVRVEGTDLPYGIQGMREATVEQVTAAVSALTRTTLDQLRRRGPARTLWMQCLVACTSLSNRAVAQVVGVSHAAVNRLEPVPAGSLRIVERVICDDRFPALLDRDLSGTWEWRRYRDARIRKGAYDLLIRQAAPQLRRRTFSRRGGLLVPDRSNKDGTGGSTLATGSR